MSISEFIQINAWHSIKSHILSAIITKNDSFFVSLFNVGLINQFNGCVSLEETPINKFTAKLNNE
jgi:hypothetical protein